MTVDRPGQKISVWTSLPPPARWQVLFTFVAALGLALLGVSTHRNAAIGELKHNAAQLAASYARNLEQRLDHGLSATYAIAAMVREGNGEFPQFESVATRMLQVYRGVSSLQLAPNGVLTQIVPLAGNEGAIGHDLFQDTRRNKEAVLARDTGQLTLAGPFKLLQGGMGMVGRLPVFVDDAQGRQRFWGFSSVLMRVDTFLKDADLARLKLEGYEYQLSRRHPDTGERDVFSGMHGDLADPVHFEFAVPNGTWRLSLMPLDGWYSPILRAAENAIAVLFALIVAAFSGYRARQPYLLQQRVDARTRELSEANLALARAESEQRKLAQAIKHSPVSIIVTDRAGIIEYVNPKFTDVTGYAADEVVGLKPSVLKSGDMSGDEYERLWATIVAGNEWRGVLHNRKKNGELIWENVTISPICDPRGGITHFVAVKEDVTARKAIEDRMQFMAHHDALTGLPNRVLLQDRFERALAQVERTGGEVAVCFLDLDRFKTINDTLGHEVGDILLQEVAQRLRNCVRETDTVCRLGGDEFVLVLSGVRNVHAVQDFTEKIQERLLDPIDARGHLLSVTFSIGVSLYPNDGRDFETLLKHADTAMYHAKESGRNTYRFFAEQMNLDAVERLATTQDLRRAVAAGELRLHYQPQIDLADGRIFGAEALVRWQHPERGLLMPGAFIPAAEDSGLIVPLGNWVLREACRQGQAWRAAGLPPVRIAVNTSAIQFRRGDLEAEVAAALAETGFDPGMLELEITESALIENPETVQAVLLRLKALGVSLAIDDFGTGYSSLSYLKRFRVDKLKIDQSFVRDIETDADDASIVAAVIEIARSLKLRTIAEGVEHPGVVDFLRAAGCDEAQGYHFGRPVAAAELAERLRAAADLERQR